MASENLNGIKYWERIIWRNLRSRDITAEVIIVSTSYFSVVSSLLAVYMLIIVSTSYFSVLSSLLAVYVSRGDGNKVHLDLLPNSPRIGVADVAGPAMRRNNHS